MFGKIFESMFTGSLVGSGAIAFAVWSYVIAHQRPRQDGKMYVELNALILGPILGEDVGAVDAVLKKFCEPDKLSRSTEEEGRRLVKEGAFLYRVVNGAYYRQIRQEQERREYQRVYHKERRQAEKEEPARRKAVDKLMRPGGARTMEERLREKAEREGDNKTIAALDRMSPHQRQVKATADDFVAKFHKSMEAANAALAAASPEAAPVDPSVLTAERADFDGEVLAANHHPEKESTSDTGSVPAEGAEGEKFPEV